MEQTQDPITLLATLIASAQQNPEQSQQQVARQALDKQELTAYQKGVNKTLMEAGQSHAAEALQNGVDPHEIANHSMMSPQQQKIQGDITTQAQQLLTPEKRTLLGNLLNTVGNLTGIGPMNAAVDNFRQNNKLNQLKTIQALTGTQQGADIDLTRQQAIALPQQTRTAQQNAQSNTLQSITQWNNSILDNALKEQELTGTEKSAKALALRAGALKDIGEYNAKLNELTPEQTADRMVSIQDKLSKTLPGYNVTQSADGKLVIQKDNSGSGSVAGIENLTPEQQLQVWDMSKKYGGVKGATRVAPSIVAQLNAGVPIDQIEDKLRYSQQSNSMSDEWRGAAQSILAKSSLTQTNKEMDALDDYVQKGDTEGGKSYLKRIALEQAPVDQKQQIMGKERTIDLLDNISKDIDTLRANGESTGFISGNLENIYARVGQVKNPEMRKVATKIASALITYRRSMTGAAFSQLESDEYKKIFPSIDKVGNFNDANISALKDVFYGDISKFYEQAMGKNNYMKLFSSSNNNNLNSQQKPSFRVIAVRE